MVERIRIGAVEYLNTKPLICDLELLAPEAELILDLPSRLAGRLAEGTLDVALIPVVEYFRGRDYSILPHMAIASRGPVLSVTIFSRKPWTEMKSLALDVGSRTSAALTQVLLKRYGAKPKLLPLPITQEAEEVDADAVLLIGDRAMRAALPGFAYSYDLGQEWHDWTGLPFVYAVWAVRPGANLGDVAEALCEAKRRGRERVAQIAYQEAQRLELDAAFCRRYLTNIIRFDLGPAELAGLERYHELTAELGLAPRETRLQFYRTPELALAE
jgi:chorismate dehydratase